MRTLLSRGSPRAVILVRRLRLAALAVALVIPAFFTHTLLTHRAQVLVHAEQQVANTARALKHHASRTVEVADARLRTVATYVRAHRDDLRQDALHEVIQEQLVGSRGLRNMFVTDSKGVAIAEAAFPARPLSVSDRDYFQILRDRPGGGVAVGRTIVGRLSGTPILPIALRLEDADGGFAGIVQASLDVDAFQYVYDGIEKGVGGLLTFWRTDGTLLVRSPPSPGLAGHSFAADATYGEWLTAEDTGARWTASREDGREQVVALSFLEGCPLYVGAALTKSQVLAPWYDLAIKQGLLGGSLTLILVIVLLVLARETERRQAADIRMRLLADNATDVFIIGDMDMRPIYVSPAARATLGHEPEELIGVGPEESIHPEDHAVIAAHWAKVMSGEEAGICAVRHRHKAGHYVWLEASASLVTDPANGRKVGFVAALRDITARRQAEEQIRHMALHDTLTGLPNRALLHDRLDQAIAYTTRTNGRFAVLACDLDRFKAVNDSLGHPAGDTLLRVVGERMRAVLHPSDTVARLGGDEFAVVLGHLDGWSPVAAIADRLIAAVGQPVDLDGRTVEVGLSIGYTIATGGDGSSDELFKRADMALYEAKAAGRNTYREFRPDVGARVATRGWLGLDMKEAIRRGEFRLVYQPVVDAAAGTVTGMEALMRWRHPDRGEVSPAEFIPLAEETGLIVTLGEWALREACREAASWPEGLRVAVNVSSIQFRRPGLETAVLGALAEAGLAAGRLEIEITESVLMDDSELAIACLHRLRGMGVRVALDDFGTGYSSLSYLRRFSFDTIKIDHSFIRDVADPDAAAIVRAVVKIGERLQMDIVAEGVETAEQLAVVRREGCTHVQGYLYSGPLSRADAGVYVLAARVKAA